MGRRGPIPKRDSKRSADGRNTLHRKTASPAPEGVDPPATVQQDSAALDFWNRHADALVEARRLRPEQAEVFGMLCHLHSDILVLMATVQAGGSVIDTQKGPVPHPAAKLLRDARRDFVSLARDFGLTAASESRLPQEPTDGEEDSDEADLRSFTG